MHDIRSDQDIRTFVHAFYGKVEKDKRLGYIFNDHAKVNWDEHLPNMVDFWSNILFRTGRYNGRPFRQHLPLPIEKEDFGRWVSLFKETIDNHFEGPKADYAKEMADKIATSFAIRLHMEGKFDNKNK